LIGSWGPPSRPAKLVSISVPVWRQSQARHIITKQSGPSYGRLLPWPEESDGLI
jgi:hypothetical protein